MAKIPLQDFHPLAWAIFWRFSLLSVVAAAVVSTVVGFTSGLVFTLLGIMDPSNTSGNQSFFSILGFLSGTVASYFVLGPVLRSLVGKKIGGFIILPLSQIVREETLHENPKSLNLAAGEAQ